MKLIPVTNMAQLRDGAKVKCRIKGERVDDARLTYEDVSWYICQNRWQGCGCRDKKGHDYSYFIGDCIDDVRRSGVSDLCVLADEEESVTPTTVTPVETTDKPCVSSGVIVAKAVEVSRRCDVYVLMVRYGRDFWCASGVYATEKEAVASMGSGLENVTEWRLVLVNGLPITVADGEVAKEVAK